jgi:putative ABC transport system permease protein
MNWSFYGGTTDPLRRTRESLVFFIALEPRKLTTMMDDLDRLPPEQDAELRRMAARMEAQRNAVILGRERMKAMNKRVGDRITVTSINYRGIDLEFEIIGTFPQGRYDQNGAMNVQYLLGALDRYEQDRLRSGGRPHDRRDSSLNVVWVRLANKEAMTRLAELVQDVRYFPAPALKIETASAGASAFLEPYNSLLWGLRWVVLPAIAATMALVIANAISISVRERRTEIALLKVLGFRPGHVMGLVLGEALFVGAAGGLLSALTAYGVVQAVGGIHFPVVFFTAFFVPAGALWRGLLLGAGAALLGSLVPAWSASRVRVSEVFAKVA